MKVEDKFIECTNQIREELFTIFTLGSSAIRGMMLCEGRYLRSREIDFGESMIVFNWFEGEAIIQDEFKGLNSLEFECFREAVEIVQEKSIVAYIEDEFRSIVEYRKRDRIGQIMTPDDLYPQVNEVIKEKYKLHREKIIEDIIKVSMDNWKRWNEQGE